MKTLLVKKPVAIPMLDNTLERINIKLMRRKEII